MSVRVRCTTWNWRFRTNVCKSLARRTGQMLVPSTNLKTLRVVDGPKIDVWTVRDGQAVNFLEMFDSFGTARALGLVELVTD